MTTNITIRTEQPADYHGIAEVHALAFTHSHGMGEVPLVDVHRHRSDYDPELSLVAEQDGKIVGHTLMTPRWVKVSNRLLRAVIVAPVAVLPGVQKTGIGGLMMEEGHQRAANKGFELAMLLGHPDYYPRFGYVTHMFGHSVASVPRDGIRSSAAGVTERRVQQTDIEHLVSWWHLWTEDVDLGIFPGNSVLDWISTDKSITSSLVEEGGVPIGYVRYSTRAPQTITCFLAAGAEAVAKILAFMNEKVSAEVENLTLPVHPDGPAAKKLVTLPYEGKNAAWAAGMIKVLNPDNQLIERYCNEVASGRRAPGQVVWPVEFDLC